MDPYVTEPLPLFAMARARQRDPITSKMAAQKMNDSGAAVDDAYVVRMYLRDHPDSTYRELSRYIGKWEDAHVMKRLDTLNKRGQAVKTGKRECAVSGNYCTTW